MEKTRMHVEAPQQQDIDVCQKENQWTSASTILWHKLNSVNHLLLKNFSTYKQETARSEMKPQV
jgi:hypothetical protein